MRRIVLAGLMGLALALWLEYGRAGDQQCCGPSCTETGVRQQCVPACSATWDEKKAKDTDYTMKCEYACARGRDSWHAPAAECRCSPPCGKVYVKKRLYKADGAEKVERVPKYDVRMVAEPCGRCGEHDGVCWWNPLRFLFDHHGR
jgi:hypothetical protein